MVFGIPLSALSISVALVGVSVNLFFTKRYPGGAYCSGDSTHEKNMLQLKLGKVADGLVVVGTLGQLISLFVKP